VKPFEGGYMLPPGVIQPMHGIVSNTKLCRAIGSIAAPLFPVWKALFPKYVTTA
jgi:hypothetical protein